MPTHSGRKRGMTTLYKAFMSYSHAADGKLAPALQRGVQRLGKPWYRRPVVRVFRDETSLSADPGLWSGIERALEQCEFFLLMASVQSATSPWARKEVEWWVGHRSVERLLIVVTDGTIAWSVGATDFDWKKTTCLPDLLQGRFREEPHYVDLRWARDRSDLSLRDSRFRNAVLTLAAPLHGRPMDELDGEDLRQQRLLRIAAGVAVVVMGVLTLVSMVERRSAQEQTRMAESRSMAAKSVELLGQTGGVDKAILLAVLAWRLSPTDEARNALEKLGSASMDVAKIMGQHTSEQIDSLAFGPAADKAPLLATGSSDGVTIMWHVPGGTVAGPPIGSDQRRIYELTFSSDGSHLLTRGLGAPTEDEPNHETIVLHDLTSGVRRIVPTDAFFLKHKSGSDLEGATSLSPDGQQVAFFSDKEIAVWNSTTGGFQYKTVPRRLIGLHFVANSRLAFVTEDSDSYIIGFTRGLWDLETGAIRMGSMVRREGVRMGNTISFSSDGSMMVIWGFNGEPAFLYQSSDGLNLQPLNFPGKAVMKNDIRFTVAFDGEGKRVAMAGNQLAAWDLAEGRVLKVIALGSGGGDGPVALSPDGRWLAGTEYGKVVIWDMNATESHAPTKTLEVACSLSGNNQRECIRRLCEKVSPLINDKDLSETLGSFDYEKLKRTALSEPCAYR
jgi:WD40 repeat protein